MAWLTIATQRFEIPDGTTVVGSGAQADWRVTGADLMPRHFVLESAEGAVRVRPFAADDVVAVNGHQSGAEPRALADGDVLAAGSGRFVYSVGEPRPDQSPAPAARDGFLVDEAAGVAHRLLYSTGIGRDPSNPILLHDPTASRFHAEVRREAGGYVLHPMGSAGTRLNGTRMGPPRLLEPGDEIEIAFVRFRFVPELPEGVAIAEHAEPVDDEAARRPTLTMANRGSGAGSTGRPPSAARGAIILGALVLGAAVLWALLRQ